MVVNYQMKILLKLYKLFCHDLNTFQTSASEYGKNKNACKV